MVCRTHKYADGGKIRKRETNLKPPEKAKGGPPKRITTVNPPGGPQTPGAKAARAKKKKKTGYADGGKVAKKGPKRRKAKPSMLGSGTAAKAGDTLKNKRKQQMKDLGI